MGLTAKGESGGLATLDADGHVPAEQLGDAGGFSQGAAVSDVAALTSSAASGGEAPTEAEYNALRTDVAAIRTTVNALLASLRAAGQIDT
ncbi:hypothetical protein E1287_07475 [Actinomadura sp. KC06]|uniref:hypothetical protein n=1 Tax=Actinomadura sp. KC06 TaxID=2530369 RepID=UPI0010510E19|nr:hypothetical protein [Actinomadura sp. KC06]TDD37888.1 hypothetical protein E1287_07475 [Actinomadura sp. KC06]